MSWIARPTRRLLSLRTPRNLCQSVRKAGASFRLQGSQQRCIHDGEHDIVSEEATIQSEPAKFWALYENSYTSPKPNLQINKQIPLTSIDQKITVTGFLGKKRTIGRHMTFVPLSDGTAQIQIFARSETNLEAKAALERIPSESAVSVTGVLGWKHEEKTKNGFKEISEDGTCFVDQLEVRLESIRCINTFPKVHADNPTKTFSATNRHLQIIFDRQLRERLELRSGVASFARKSLELSSFQEIETPLLFKSTPEGAKEFIVPTRRKNYVYALPQSPQQPKQILMASRIKRYFQIAKCFRDEDTRADRQPEFTQLDLEMSWADGEDVMQWVEQFMKSLWGHFAKPGSVISEPLPEAPFARMSYAKAMSNHGSDKPDCRIKSLIHRIDHILPADLMGMLTSIRRPIVEAWKVRLDGSASTTQKFITEFLDSQEAGEFRSNPAGAPGIFIFDPRKPLEGLQAFGFEGAEDLKALYAEAAGVDAEFEEGDLLLIQARENLPFTGGSTMLGRLRLAIQKAALVKNLIEPDNSHQFLWITDFPMFTLNNDVDPGQGGASGFSATHHPFTAPKTSEDVHLLRTNPLEAVADHYDLVVNGVELGGGSRRIHVAEVQRFVMQEVLKMSPQGIENFEHLFRALEAGCPPHAGLAIGFDRLIAVMTGCESVRDVIAFPKDKRGTDLMVKSPTLMTKQQKVLYHLTTPPLAAAAVALSTNGEADLTARNGEDI